MTDKYDEIAAFLNGVLEKWEKRVPHAYADVKGNVTIGEGFLVKNANDMKKCFLLKKNGRPASDAEKAADFDRVVKIRDSLGKNGDDTRPYNYKAAVYDANDALIMPDGEIDRIKNEQIRRHIMSVEKKCAGFDGLPLCVRAVLTDMEYNMGSRFTRKTYPVFFKALDGRDFETAAAQSATKDLNPERNAWRFETLLKARQNDLSA